jgi:phosphonate transport system substrate-binding protein
MIARLAVVAVLVGSARGGETHDESAEKTARPPRPPKLEVDANADPVRIAFISYANPQQVLRDSKTVVKFLEPYVGRRVDGFVTTDYGSSIEALRGKKADVAFVDPLAFMMAHERIGAKPMLLEVYSTGQPTYYSNIWVKKGGGIEKLKDLKGKTIAFADQVDMSGHLMPRDIFVREKLASTRDLEGKFFERIWFAGGDEQAVRSVINGFVDAAGVSQFAYLLLRPEERDQLTPIARSVESPSHLAMARRGLPDETCERIMKALLSLDPKESEDKAILDRLYGVQGYIEAKLSDFETVAKLAGRYGFVKKPELFASEKKPDQDR